MYVTPHERAQRDQSKDDGELDASGSNEPTTDRTRRALTLRPKQVQGAAKVPSHAIHTGLGASQCRDVRSLDGEEPVPPSEAVMDHDAIGRLYCSNCSPFYSPLEDEVPTLKGVRTRVDPRPGHGIPHQDSELCNSQGERAGSKLETWITDHRGRNRSEDEDRHSHAARRIRDSEDHLSYFQHRREAVHAKVGTPPTPLTHAPCPAVISLEPRQRANPTRPPLPRFRTSRGLPHVQAARVTGAGGL